jgi:WD40 repeat protein
VAHSSFTELPVGYAFNINEIAFQPNSSVLAIGIHGYFLGDPDSGRARVILWNTNNPAPDLTDGLPADSFIAYRFGELNSLAYNPSGTQLATGTNSGGGSADTQVTASARIWNPTNHKLIGTPLDGHDRAGDINGLAYSADGRYLIAAHGSGKIDFIDARSFKAVDTLYAGDLIGAIAVNPRIPMFVATDNNKLMIWSFK